MRRTSSAVSAAIAFALLSALPVYGQATTSTNDIAAKSASLSLTTPSPVALRYHTPQAPTVSAHISDAPVVDAPTPTPSGFASTGFAQFMSSPVGRIARVVAGAGMIAGGIAMDSDGGTVLAAAGGVPLLAGALDFCVLSPLFGGPFWGKDIRAAK